jgi:hypothetical protein
MPINENYFGDTFVAYVDISGFKQLMKEKRALSALDNFYETGYDILRKQNRISSQIDGIFISDCGILFVRKNYSDNFMCLSSLLDIIKKINEQMWKKKVLLTTSIAYGQFMYQKRQEFDGIGKNPIYGEAYISAFLDSEEVKPKILPGQCRIVKENLPEDICDVLSDAKRMKQLNERDILNYVKPRKGDNNHLYYYWMVLNSNITDRFEEEYCKGYNPRYPRYTTMYKAIDKYWRV